MFKTVFFVMAWAVLALITVPSGAFAGCIGAAIGEGCIGVPTPHEYGYRYGEREHERHHHETVIIRRHHHYDGDDDE